MTNLLLSLLLLLTGAGIAIFVNGKAELKRDIKEIKDELDKLRDSHNDLRVRITKVETHLKIED